MAWFRRAVYFANVTVLNAEGAVGESLRIKGRRVAAINEPPQKDDVIIDGQGGLLIPGMINAHDHLELNTFKRLKYRDAYNHSVQWIEDIEARFDVDPDLVEPRRQSLDDRLLVGALKNLLSGVTTVCHHNPRYRQLRYHYPVRVVRNYNYNHSLHRGEDARQSYQKTRPGQPWIIHLAEGVDADAAAEFDRLDALGAVRENTLLVHGVGLTGEQRRGLIERGGGLIWCPGSNLFMFGKTARVQNLAAAGKLALGSDSRLSGEVDLLAELRVAHQTGQLSPQQLFKTVTVDAARMLRLTGGGGHIHIGDPADLVLLPPLSPLDPYAQLVNLTRAQLQLVMLDGRPLVASPHLAPIFEATRTRFGPVLVDQSEKLMIGKLITRLKKSPVAEPGLALR